MKPHQESQYELQINNWKHHFNLTMIILTGISTLAYMVGFFVGWLMK